MAIPRQFLSFPRFAVPRIAYICREARELVFGCGEMPVTTSNDFPVNLGFITSQDIVNDVSIATEQMMAQGDGVRSSNNMRWDTVAIWYSVDRRPGPRDQRPFIGGRDPSDTIYFVYGRIEAELGLGLGDLGAVPGPIQDAIAQTRCDTRYDCYAYHVLCILVDLDDHQGFADATAIS